MEGELMEILGYYPVINQEIIQDPICADCVKFNGHGKNCPCCEPWDIDAAEPIFSWTESDTPTFCTACSSLIPHNLTREGLEYVRDWLQDPGGLPEYREQLLKAYLAYLPIA